MEGDQLDPEDSIDQIFYHCGWKPLAFLNPSEGHGSVNIQHSWDQENDDRVALDRPFCLEEAFAV